MPRAWLPRTTSVVLAVAALSSAVTWQKDSRPFLFPSSGVIERAQVNMPAAAIQCTQRRGTITISFTLARGIRPGRIVVHSPNGKLVRVLETDTRSGKLLWDAHSEAVARGVYLIGVDHPGISQTPQTIIVR